MKYLSQVWQMVRAVFKTLRLALPKLGVGWMFALLTINFNRITIYELQITAVAVTAMLALQYFTSPFQVVAGRIADRYPIMGLRRTPYMLISSTIGGLVFLALPSVATAMGQGAPIGFVLGTLILLTFGICNAFLGDAHHALIAEVTTSKSRGAVISVVWTFTILSTIIAAGVMSKIMPEYSPEAMQRLYNLTPFVAIGSTLLGVIGMEKRLTGEQLRTSIAKSKEVTPQGNPVQAAITLLRENSQAAGFFAFIFVSILSIFLQDNILEPFGAEVFGMSPAETNQFQPAWGSGALLGMLGMGAISAIFAISKRNIALFGCVGTAIGMGFLATGALIQQQEWIRPSLMMMGLFTGIFNVGALSMMMDMTVEGATGLYMGMWGMAQAFGNGVASFGGGVLHTGLIETGFLTPNAAYFFIFGLESLGMITAAVIVWHLSVARFHNLHEDSLSSADAVRAMEASAAI